MTPKTPSVKEIKTNMTMSVKNMELMYWNTNKEWYKLENGKIVLTDKAPERAKKSLEMWRRGKLDEEEQK